MTRQRLAAHLLLLAGLAAPWPAVAAGEARAALRQPGDATVLALDGRGTQVYACRATADGAAPTWTFVRPEAELFENGTRVGTHGAGPFWASQDGSRITGRLVAKADGDTPADIPWLRLEVDSHAGAGVLSPVTVVLRTATRGGVLAGPCQTPGDTRAVPYTATYLFVTRP